MTLRCNNDRSEPPMRGGCKEKKYDSHPMHAPNVAYPPPPLHRITTHIQNQTHLSVKGIQAFRFRKPLQGPRRSGPLLRHRRIPSRSAQRTQFSSYVVDPRSCTLPMPSLSICYPHLRNLFFCAHIHPCTHALFACASPRTARGGAVVHHMPGGCNGCVSHNESFPDLHPRHLQGLQGFPTCLRLRYCMFATRFAGFSSRSSSMRLWFLRRPVPSRYSRTRCLDQRVFRACRADWCPTSYRPRNC